MGAVKAANEFEIVHCGERRVSYLSRQEGTGRAGDEGVRLAQAGGPAAGGVDGDVAEGATGAGVRFVEGGDSDLKNLFWPRMDANEHKIKPKQF